VEPRRRDDDPTPDDAYDTVIEPAGAGPHAHDTLIERPYQNPPDTTTEHHRYPYDPVDEPAEPVRPNAPVEPPAYEHHAAGTGEDVGGRAAAPGEPESLPPMGAPPRGGAGARNWLILGGVGCTFLLAACLIVGAAAWMLGGIADPRGDDTDNPISTATTEQIASDATATPDTPASTPTETAESTIPPEPTPEPTIEPEPTEVGATRGNPVPLGEVGTNRAGDWRVRVNEVYRGDEAWQRLLEANPFNWEPEDGMEYVLFNVTMTYVGSATVSQHVSSWDFQSTGDAGVKWPHVAVVHPTPELNAGVFQNGETTGWVVVQVRAGESNPIAVFQPSASWEEEYLLFLALEDGASVPSETARAAAVNELGTDRANPAPLGEHIVSEVWELWIIEALRGDAAWEMVQSVSSVNTPPEPGMEYVVVHVGARNARAGHDTDYISYALLDLTGDANVLHERPPMVQPTPGLNYEVYPGGTVDGWIILQAQAGESGLMLVFQAAWWPEDIRYLALQ
jgi:hypothetical protein